MPEIARLTCVRWREGLRRGVSYSLDSSEAVREAVREACVNPICWEAIHLGPGLEDVPTTAPAPVPHPRPRRSRPAAQQLALFEEASDG